MYVSLNIEEESSADKTTTPSSLNSVPEEIRLNEQLGEGQQ